MSETARKRDLRTVPMYRRRPAPPASGGSTRVAWALFLVLGLPFGLMTVLDVLAGSGVVISLFSPLWQPWPPELVKPFLGVAVFAATLAYLAYRMGHRSGFRVGTGVGLAAARNKAESRPAPAAVAAAEAAGNESSEGPPPPPPPEAAEQAPPVQ